MTDVSREQLQGVAVDVKSSGKKKTPKQDMNSKLLWSKQILKQDSHLRFGPASRKMRVYNFLERPQGLLCIFYHCAVFLLVLVCLTFSVLSTMEEFADFANKTIYWMEIGLVIFFSLEYMIRIWSAGCSGKYVGFIGRLRFIRKPICVIDFIVVVTSVFIIFSGSNGQVFAASAIRGIRFMQILRMLRVDRQGGTWQLLGSVIYNHRQELITTLYIGFLGLIFSSYFIFLAEKDVPDVNGNYDFASFADALWWGVATYTTIGYGDKVPRTWTGRAVTCFFSLVIISFITLPSGILGSGFALKVQQKQRQKHFNRQFPTAAYLIQCAWRSHAVEKPNPSSVTWNIHLQPTKYESLTKKKLSVYLRKKPRSKSENPTPDTKIKNEKRFSSGQDNYSLQEGFINDGVGSMASLNEMRLESLSTEALDSGELTGDELDYDNDQLQRVTELTTKHKNAIRAIRKMKFLVAKKHFELAKKPYDVQDVLEQYSQGHLNMMFRIKELQRRLERTLGKPPPRNPTDGGPPKAVTIGARLLRVEHKINVIEKKTDQILAILSASKEAHSLKDENKFKHEVHHRTQKETSHGPH